MSFCTRGLILLSALSIGAADAMARPAGKAQGKVVSCEAPLPLVRKHRVMQQLLQKRLRKAKLTPWIRQDKLSVAVVDLSYGEPIFYSGINENEMMYAASLPKIAVLLAVASQANAGAIRWTNDFDKRLKLMITESSNSEASWGVDQVGISMIEQVLRSRGNCFYDDVRGGLWVGRAFRGGGERKPDPVADVVHGATARQAVRFVTMLNQGKLITPEWSTHMLSLMAPPKHHHKFVRGLMGRKGVEFLARKSGTWANFHSDVALIQHGEFRYAVAALSESRKGEELMQRVIRVVDDMVMEGRYRKRRPSSVHAQR